MRFAIVVAGGSGSRIGTETPKQFLLLGDKPLLMHTISKFYLADPKITLIVVLPEKDILQWKSLCKQHSFNVAHQVAIGGETRYHSVKNGLAAITKISSEDTVAVHDGARPLVPPTLITKCFEQAEQKGNAVPYILIPESLRKKSHDESGTEIADRERFVLIQTPQCFNLHRLKAAYAQPYNDSFTDDASVFEAFGENIHLIEGERENIKITYPSDLKVAAALLSD